MVLPKEIKRVLDMLGAKGYEAYCVGGCVRDSLLHRSCNDYDVTTSATIQQIHEVFQEFSSFDLGKKNGTVTIHIGEHFVEITPFKGKNLEEDLMHRDFTMNALAYSLSDGIIDITGGQEDIKQKQIRFVGNGHERIQEDSVRMMRAVRFACTYGFTIEKESKQCILDNVKSLKTTAKERIREELLKILKVSEDGILMLYNLGLLNEIEPKLSQMFTCKQNNTHHYTDVGSHTLDALQESYSISVKYDDCSNLCIRMALLFHDIGKVDCKTTDENGVDHFYRHAERSVEIASQFLNKYKFSNKEKLLIEKLIRWHDYPLSTKLKSLKKVLIEHQLFPDFMSLLLGVQTCDKSAQNFSRDKMHELLDFSYHYFKEVGWRPYRISQLCIDGNDILNIIPEISPKKIPKIQKFCLKTVFMNPGKNEKENLIQLLKQHKKRFLERKVL